MKRITQGGKTLFKKTVMGINFTNRRREEDKMWSTYTKLNKRKLDDDNDSDDDHGYENRYFKDKDESMRSLNDSKMDISMHESNLSNLKHLKEKESVKKLKTPSKTSAKSSSSRKESSSSKKSSSKYETSSDSESSSDDECMVDNSFSSIDNKLIKTPKSKRACDKKIKLREKQLAKLKKKEKKEKKKAKKKKKSKKNK